MYELKGGPYPDYTGVLRDMRRAGGIGGMTKVFMDDFEDCTASVCHFARRKRYAHKVYGNLAPGPVGPLSQGA